MIFQQARLAKVYGPVPTGWRYGGDFEFRSHPAKPASTAPAFVATAASACADAFACLIQIAAMEHLRSLHSNPMSIDFVFFT
jgi:hypothetical protein